jgi:hypothetical protein
MSQPTISLWNPSLEAVPAGEFHFRTLKLPIKVNERFAFNEVVVGTWAEGIIVVTIVRRKRKNASLPWKIGMVPFHRL